MCVSILVLLALSFTVSHLFLSLFLSHTHSHSLASFSVFIICLIAHPIEKCGVGRLQHKYVVFLEGSFELEKLFQPYGGDTLRALGSPSQQAQP